MASLSGVLRFGVSDEFSILHVGFCCCGFVLGVLDFGRVEEEEVAQTDLQLLLRFGRLCNRAVSIQLKCDSVSQQFSANYSWNWNEK